MKTFSAIRSKGLSGRTPEAGFTMAEIAIALGVIAFALIAIIGILPSGLQVQRDNREETIINQDARLLVQAIRSGGRDAASDLGAFVVSVDNGPDLTQNNPPGITTSNLVELLSDSVNGHTIVLAAISGGIASRGTDLSFRYQVVNQVVDPLDDVNAFGGTNLFGAAGELGGGGLRLTNHLHDVRLRFSWPVKRDGTLGSEANRYVVRTFVSGWQTGGVFYAQEFVNPTNGP